MKRLFDDPLVRFLAAGAGLFIVLSAIKPASQDDQITVDRDALLTFVQYRSKAFEPRAAAAILDDMSAQERRRLIDDYIREEALYREAQKLGLNDNDYVIRRRMVQKLEFITEAAIAPQPGDAAALAAYYQDHKSRYYHPPSATFAHVFVSAKSKSPDAVLSEARSLLETLSADKARFEDATRYGDRFLFHTNYVERTYDYVESHFGAAAAAFVFSDKTPLSEWAGPVTSEHGAHLIYATARAPGRTPPLADIKSVVAGDMARDVRRQQIDALIDAIVDDYHPVVEPDAAAPAKAQGSRR